MKVMVSKDRITRSMDSGEASGHGGRAVLEWEKLKGRGSPPAPPNPP